MYGHHCRHSTTIAKTTAPRAVDKYVLHSAYQIMKHTFMAVLVHYPYFMPPKMGENSDFARMMWGPKMVPFCCFAPLNCVSRLLPIHPGWEHPLHYAWLCSRETRLCAQHDFFDKAIGGTMGLLTRASTWEDSKPLVAGTGHYVPTKGMTLEGQKTIIMVAIHAATTRL